ncbi:MAG TPA: PEP/pyruvate-binding domain-containing protein [Verrucomicrobiales bacterium]|nr:PEP/pyruvate-binding domain-containing protein [Verrucomicrobiales bacterium]
MRGFALLMGIAGSWAGGCLTSSGGTESRGLDIRRSGDHAVLSGDTGEEAALFLLECSLDLQQWDEIARVHRRLLPYPQPADAGAAFYRLGSRRQMPEADDWTNQLDLENRSFFLQPPGTGLGSAPFVKFTLNLDLDRRVYFQDTIRYPFHFPFIRGRMPGYADITLIDFERLALRVDGQRLAVGTLVLAPDPAIREAGLIFEGSEPFPRERIVEWFGSTLDRIGARDAWTVFYLPSFEQLPVARENEDYFRERGIVVESASRWAGAVVCYARGWALGRVKAIAGSEIIAAYGDGRLSNADILLTDHLPAEIPLVAGVITTEPATPNSHVAILARSYGMPFAYVGSEALQERFRAVAGKEILLVLDREPGGECEVEITETEELLSDERRREILESKRPPALVVPPREDPGWLTAPVSGLWPEDARYVGGKSAHYGFLLREAPESTRPALAFSFALWEDYLNQALPGGQSLGGRIAQRLEGHTFPPDMLRLREDLAVVRSWIEDVGDFDAGQRNAIVVALSGFDQDRKIRFRSSTNVEDSAVFTGAGLYDSYSGCLADDVDGDEHGPSRCDSGESKERGVFRALRKVFASFYNETAFVERLRFGIAEADVGMAVLAHHSFLDEDELANGVAIWEIHGGEGEWEVRGELVTQLGAVSVTNPDGNTPPEVVEAVYAGSVAEAALEFRQQSALVESGTVMEWEEDYRVLAERLDAVARAYAGWAPFAEEVVLDFEFKKIRGEGIVLKQARPAPQPQQIPPPALDEIAKHSP